MNVRILLLLLLPISLNAQSDNFQQLDAFIEKALADWKAPGTAVVVVKDGQTVFQNTYGITDIYSRQKTDEHTLWMMGSTTKAVTALAIGVLVDQGKLHWDDKVIDHLPNFQLKDPYIQSELIIRDLLTHRAGYGSTDLLWASGLTSDEVLFRMRYAEPAYSLRSDYTYQNVMYLAAGRIIEKISGQPWEDFIQDQIFEPLGMDRTISNASQRFDRGNFVYPHDIVLGKVDTVLHLSAEEIAPAGDIWSSISDMNTWVRFWLNEGSPDGVQIVSKNVFQELFKPHTIVPKEKFYPTAQLTQPYWTTYALGWFQQDYRGDALDFHTGSLPGLTAIFGLIREEGFGVYVFGNLDHAEMRHAIMLKAIDLYVHEDDARDWHQEIYDLYKGIENQAEARQEKLKESRMLGTGPTFDWTAYTGVYEHTMMGQMIIGLEEEKLTFEFNSGYNGYLDHWHYDTFNIIDQPTDGINLAQFVMDATGQIMRLKALGYDFDKVE